MLDFQLESNGFLPQLDNQRSFSSWESVVKSGINRHTVALGLGIQTSPWLLL